MTGENPVTWQEIVSQPDVWQATLAALGTNRDTLSRFLHDIDPAETVVIGCGSTHYLARAAAAMLTHVTGRPSWAGPSSELLLFSDTLSLTKPLLIAVSRSGATTETLWALNHFRDTWHRPVLSVTCYPDSPMARQSDFVLAATEAQEQSIAQTRSFVSMYILVQAVAATMAEDSTLLAHLTRLPKALQVLSDQLGDLPRRLGANLSLERFFFLGGGPYYGLACEAMLKMKEMTLSYSEAFHPLEFRHGPMSMVNDQTLVIGFISDSGADQEVRVLQDMDKLGAQTLAIVEDKLVLNGWQPDYVIELRSGLDEWTRGALYLPPLQRMAYHRAVAKGLNPDTPTNLTAVVEL